MHIRAWRLGKQAGSLACFSCFFRGTAPSSALPAKEGQEASAVHKARTYFNIDRLLFAVGPSHIADVADCDDIGIVGLP